LAITAFLCAAAASADADPERYVGPHPIPEARKGAYCYIELAHNHGYAPDAGEYVMTEGGRDFVGDPSEHGYEGPLFAYSGAHVSLREGGDTCYRQGEHFHDQLPQHEEKFIEKDGVLHGKEVSKEELAALEEAATPAAEAPTPTAAPEPKQEASSEPATSRTRASRSSSASKRRRKAAARPKPAAVPPPTPPPAPAPVAAAPAPKLDPAAEKAKKAAHKSWMDRRMGR